MPLYRYKALRTDGAMEEGQLDAESATVVAARLQDAGVLPVQVEAVGEWRGRLRWQRGRKADAELIARELGILMRAGLPLEQAIEALLEMGVPEGTRRALDGLAQGIRGGEALSKAMAAQPEVFTPAQLAMIGAGEAGGRLAQSLGELAAYLARRRALREGLVSALIYPVILVSVAAASLLVLLAWVVPQFAGMFASLGGTLPLPTRIVIGAGELARDFGWLLPVAALAAYGYLKWAYRSPARAADWDARWLRIPLAGSLALKVEIARFCRTLGMLLANGVALIEALKLARSALGNRYLRQAMETVEQKARAGQGLARPLAATGVVPPLAVRLASVGEESGELAAMLLRVADAYEAEVQTASSRLLSILEPVLIIVLGVIIAAIVLAIMLAVTGLQQLV